MTLVELSLYMEGFEQRLRTEDRLFMQHSWTSAYLARVNRLPSLESWLTGDKAVPLSKNEAEAHAKRHAELIARIAPEASTDRAELMKFVEEQDKIFRNRMEAERLKEESNG